MLRRTLAMTAAALALVGGTAFGAATTATAAAGAGTTGATAVTPVARGMARPAPHHLSRTGTATAAAVSTACNPRVWIGDTAPYGWQGWTTAGWVQQYWNQCDDHVGVYWWWSSDFTSQFPGATVSIKVGSPYGPLLAAGHVDTSSPEWYFEATQWTHGKPSPDAWRSGAEVNSSGCTQWATLHWYGGEDWDGARGGCGNPYPPLRDGSQP